ncbi:MAG TPA: biotin synthase BioB [Nitrospiria bacterium]|nr:biotin synthase BioB [Nitrospiria bacterium]
MVFQILADKALRGECPTREEARTVLKASDDQLPDLIQAAWRIRFANSGRRVKLHMLINAKSGLCEEDCHYCSQSRTSTADIDSYPLLSEKEILDGARRAVEAKALRYCIVISGRGPRPKEMAQIASAVRTIKQETPLSLCCSLGLLTPEDAKTLKAAGVDRVNHNLNASERFYKEVCSTHTYGDRIETLKNAREAGLELCSGGIVGMGESDEDLIDMALALREIKPDSIPINFLHPVEGTPLGSQTPPSPTRGLKVLCLFRFLHPTTEIRIAGGREHNLRSLQAQALYIGDSLFVGGYLTTPGQKPEEAWRMIEDLGFEVEEPNPAVR